MIRFSVFYTGEAYDSEALWKQVKPVVREIHSDDACIIFDDTIAEKQWTDENSIICRHFDHTKGRSVKRVNLLNRVLA